MLAVASGGFLTNAWGADEFVVAETSFGKVRGVNVNGLRTFKGIPYGANISGKNRFMPPANPTKWTGVKDALQYGFSAPVHGKLGRLGIEVSERTVSRLLRRRRRPPSQTWRTFLTNQPPKTAAH